MLHTVVVDDFFDNVDDIINLSKEKDLRNIFSKTCRFAKVM